MLILIPFNVALRIKYQIINRTLIINLFMILNIRFYCTFIVIKGNQLLDAIVWYATTHAEGLYVIQLHNRNNVLWLLELPLKVSMKMHQKPVVIMKKSFIAAQNGRFATQKGSKFCIFVCLQHSFQLISYHVMQIFPI